MKKIMIAAMGSGSGKTIFTCGLIVALKKQGLKVHPFKTGPDYIDPMYLSRAAGEPCRNLDIFLQGEDGVRRTFSRGCAFDDDKDIAVIEAAMGYYDGVAGTDEASAYNVARLLSASVILAVNPAGSSMTLAAQIRGMMDFRTDSHISGIVMTDCSKKYYEHLKPLIESECGLTVFGFLPHVREAEFSSRHLGLYMAGEYEDIDDRFLAISDEILENVDVQGICCL